MFDRDYEFKGKHSDYVKALSQGNNAIFSRVIDVYILAPLVGFYYGHQGGEDSSSNSQTRIFAEVMIKEQQKLKFIYKLIILLDQTASSEKERINRAFMDREEDYTENTQIFNSYVLGGVEKLYEKIVADIDKVKVEDFVDSIYEFVDSFSTGLDAEGIEDLSEILQSYS